MSEDAPDVLDLSAKGKRFGVLAARYNVRLVEGMLARCVATLEAAGGRVDVYRVPGSNELPYAAGALQRAKPHDALICLGVIIRGETAHHDVIAHSTAAALHGLAIDAQVPVINGIICAETEAQAEARTIGKHDRGPEFARAAIEMLHFLKD